MTIIYQNKIKNKNTNLVLICMICTANDHRFESLLGQSIFLLQQ